MKKGIVATTLVAVMLSACGGGGSNEPVAGAASLRVNGTAATGMAIAGAPVSAKCKSGTGSTTSGSDGTFSLSITDGLAPCVLQVTNPQNGLKLHSLFASTSDVTANITPLTEMVFARTVGAEPSIYYATFDPKAATDTITPNKIAGAQANIVQILTGVLNVDSTMDFIASPLKAASQDNPAGGNEHDKLLDGLANKISATQLTQVVAMLSTKASTDEIKQGISELVAVPPIARPGTAQNVSTGSIVTLNGSESSADAGRTLSYSWTITTKPTGSTVTLVGANSAKPTLSPDIPGIYVVSLVVNDGRVDSSPAAVTITVSAANSAPIANAGASQNVLVNTPVVLDGSASSDADRDALSYIWALSSKPSGSTATLITPNQPLSGFTPDKPGTYIATLTVSDGQLVSLPSTVVINVGVLNVAPVANAGHDQTVIAGASPVFLDGSASTDANGDPLSYYWTFISVPNDSASSPQPFYTSRSIANPTVFANVPGTYVVSLVVSDGKVNSQPSTVTITAIPASTNSPPEANAGGAQNVILGSIVTLDGSASRDANGDSLTYSWALTSKPSGSSAALSSSTAVKPTFVADVAGSYIVTLIVNDGKTNSSPITATITTTAVKPTSVTGTILADTTWESGTYLLDGTVSVPPGVTLTIKPGVTVVGKDSKLLVAGSLIAEGTQTNKIRFTSLPAFVSNEATRSHYGIVLDNSSTSRIEHVIIENGWTGLSLDGTSVIALRNVVFRNNGVAVTDTYGYQFMDIQHCSFYNNDSAFEGIRTLGGTFAWNDFQNNKNVFSYGYYFGQVNINNNNFIGSNLVVRAPEVGYGYGSLDLTNNWWGTSDIQLINQMIYDLFDLGTLQQIPYAPLLTAPANAGASM